MELNHFSPTEKKIIKTLGKRRMTITQLTEKMYKDEEPLNARNNISSAILHINKKCKYYKLDWSLKGEGLGRGGKTVWIEET